MRKRPKYRSALHYVISSLIPYTEANLKLSFSPHRFFNDLEAISNRSYSMSATRGAYYRALKEQLVEIDTSGVPTLTARGVEQLQLYEPRYLDNDAAILLIFDIPEDSRQARRRLRAALRKLHFTPVQQSVWQTNYDVMNLLKSTLADEQLEEYVQVYESVRII